MNDLSDAERVLTGTNEVIAFNRAYARICGFDPVAGLVLSQLMYWAKKKKINFQPFYKTNAELKEECTCSLSQVKNAKEKLIKLGFVKTQIKGIPARTFYTINRKEIVEAILKLEEEETAENSSWSDSTNKLEPAENPVGQIQPTSWSNSTSQLVKSNQLLQETTQKTTQKNVKKNFIKKSSVKKPNEPKKVSLEELSVEHVREWLSEKRMKGEFFHIDEKEVLETFKDYCRANGKQYKDYVAAYRNAFSWSRFKQKPNKISRDDALEHAFREGLRKTIPGQGGVRDIFELE